MDYSYFLQRSLEAKEHRRKRLAATQRVVEKRFRYEMNHSWGEIIPGKFRKFKPGGCRKAKCFYCHSDKLYPKHRRAGIALFIDEAYEEILQEYLDRFGDQSSLWSWEMPLE